METDKFQSVIAELLGIVKQYDDLLNKAFEREERQRELTERLLETVKEQASG